MIYAIGERYRPLFEKNLQQLEISPIWLPDNPLLDERLAAHADLSIYSENNNIIVSKGLNLNIVNYLTNRGLIIKYVSAEEGKIYPNDVRLCVLDTGKYLIYNPNTADAAFYEILSERIGIPVSQGYTKCSSCVVNKDSIVTADRGVSAVAKKHGIDVLDIESGFIELNGFNEGFIGGASFRYHNKIIFSGHLNEHPDKYRILHFLHKKSMEATFLTEMPIFDFGGAVGLP